MIQNHSILGHRDLLLRFQGPQCLSPVRPVLAIHSFATNKRFRFSNLRLKDHCTAPAATSLSTSLVPPSPPPRRTFTTAGWIAAIPIAAISAVVLFKIFEQFKGNSQSEDLEETHEVEGESDGYESEAYKIVLNSVRQNITFQRALQSMREGDTSRAMVELHRVLEHNAVCRKPINLDYYETEDLEGIYRLHLQNSELPLQYSTLIHLRQLLQLSNEKAEALEGELKSSAYQFNI